MTTHWHASVDNILLYGLSAILVINVIRILAHFLAKMANPLLASIGNGLGAVVA